MLPRDTREASDLDTRQLPTAVAAAALLVTACPQYHNRWSHLEAGRNINDKLAVAAAIRHAAALRDRRGSAPSRADMHKYKRPTSTREIVATFHREYGRNSLVSRGADAIASIAIAAEDTTQVPLDTLSAITGTIFEAGSRVLGVGEPPRLKLRSGITAGSAGVTLSTDW